MEGLAIDSDGVDAGELGKRVVSEDVDAAYLTNLALHLAGHLMKGAVVVQPAETSNAGLGQGRVLGQYEGVGVAGVGHHEALYVRLGTGEGCSLFHEDLLVHGQQVLPLHAWLTWEPSHKNYNIALPKLLLRVAARADLTT